MANQWADNVIVAVRYSQDPKHIDCVRVRQYNGASLSAPFVWTKDQVVSKIEDGHKTFCTAYEWDGPLHRGADVEVISVNSVKYIRTDKDQIAADNLGQLPKF